MKSFDDAARRVLELEGNPKGGALFFEVYVDPDPRTGHTQDADVLSRLDYRTPKRFYILERDFSQKGKF